MKAVNDRQKHAAWPIVFGGLCFGNLLATSISGLVSRSFELSLLFSLISSLLLLGLIFGRRSWQIFLISFFFGWLLVSVALAFKSGAAISPGPIDLEAVILSRPEKTASTLRAVVRPAKGLDLLVYGDELRDFSAGEKIRISGDLKKPEKFSSFDYPNFLLSRNISGIIFRPTIVSLSTLGSRVLASRAKLEGRIRESVGRYLISPKDDLFLGMVFGLKDDLPDRVADDFRRTGLTHILVASGFNVSLIFAFLAGLKIFSPNSRLIGGSLLLVVYLSIAGFEPPLVRAVIFGLLMILSQTIGRPANFLRLLSITAGLMIVENPLILRFDPSFQLSFLAATGLIIFGSRASAVSQALTENRVFASALGATFSAGLLVFPFSAWQFGQISTAGPIVNPIVLFAVPIIIILGMIALPIGFLTPVLGRAIYFLVEKLIDFILTVVALFRRLPFFEPPELLRTIGFWLFVLAFFWLLLSWLKGDGEQV